MDQGEVPAGPGGPARLRPARERRGVQRPAPPAGQETWTPVGLPPGRLRQAGVRTSGE
jgi:hypothetical protein